MFRLWSWKAWNALPGKACRNESTCLAVAAGQPCRSGLLHRAGLLAGDAIGADCTAERGPPEPAQPVGGSTEGATACPQRARDPVRGVARPGPGGIRAGTGATQGPGRRTGDVIRRSAARNAVLGNLPTDAEFQIGCVQTARTGSRGPGRCLRGQ